MATQRIAAFLGDFYHKPDAQRDALRAAAASFGAGLDVFLDPLDFRWDSLSQWDVIVMAREGRVAPEKSKDIWITTLHEHVNEPRT